MLNKNVIASLLVGVALLGASINAPANAKNNNNAAANMMAMQMYAQQQAAAQQQTLLTAQATQNNALQAQVAWQAAQVNNPLTCGNQAYNYGAQSNYGNTIGNYGGMPNYGNTLAYYGGRSNYGNGSYNQNYQWHQQRLAREQAREQRRLAYHQAHLNNQYAANGNHRWW